MVLTVTRTAVDPPAVLEDLQEGARHMVWRVPLGEPKPSHQRPCLSQKQLIGRLLVVSLYLIVRAPTSAAAALQVSGAEEPFASPQLLLERTVTIRGTPRGGPELTAPRSLLTDSNTIYVLDPTAFGVYRFDRLGNWLGMIGDEGDGPGEFRRPTEMGWSSDTLWIADRRLGRLTLIERESQSFSRTVQFRIASAESTTVPRGRLGASILGVPQLLPQSTADVDSIPLLLMDEEGNVQDTLAWRIIGRGTVRIPAGANSAGGQGRYGTLTVSHPFDVRSMMAVDPKGRWIYLGTWRTRRDDEGHFELAQISAIADTLAVAELPFDRYRVSRQDVDFHARGIHGALPEAVREGMSAQGLREELFRQIRDPRQSTVDAMISSEDGVIWFRRTARPREGSRRRQWAAYRMNQGFTGVVVFPPGHDLLAASGGLLWTTSRDDFEVPTIAGWRVTWPRSDR